MNLYEKRIDNNDYIILYIKKKNQSLILIYLIYMKWK